MKITLTVSSMLIVNEVEDSVDNEPIIPINMEQYNYIVDLMKDFGFTEDEIYNAKENVEKELSKTISLEHLNDILGEKFFNQIISYENANPNGIVNKKDGNIRKPRCEIRDDY